MRMDLDRVQNILVGESKEKRLFSKIKKKDKEAFIKAYDLYIDQIYRFIYFKVSNKEEANDLTSVVFLKTWNYIQDNRVGDFKTLRALIYTIARTSVIDYYRKNSYSNKISIDDEEKRIDIADERQNILKQIEISSDFKIIENKLCELKDEYREIIVLRFINELSVSEIAIIINKPRGNVRVLIHRALKALRELVE